MTEKVMLLSMFIVCCTLSFKAGQAETRPFGTYLADPTHAKEKTEPEWKAEADETHELLERLAKEAESAALVKKHELFLEAKKEYERDIAGFSFHCHRFGDFLKISIARMGNPTEPKDRLFFVEKPQQKYSTSLNLKNIERIKLIEGHVPDMSGYLSYGYWLPSNKNDGAGEIGGTGYGNFRAPEGYRWEVKPNYPDIPYSRRLFHVDQTPEKQEEIVYNVSDTSYSINYRTRDYTRVAEDDQIIFEGIRSTLYVPAGKGKEVLQQILSAKEQ